MNLKRGDYGVFVLALLAVAGFAAAVYGQDLSPAMVRIECEGRSWVYPIDEDRQVSVEGPRGDTVVQIKDSLVRVKESPCPHKLCVSQGWQKHPGAWVACLPNRVIVSIEGEGDREIDGFSL
jgi:hypothetical protein